MDARQQVMSPNGQDEPMEYIVQDHVIPVGGLDDVEKGQGGGNVVVSTALLLHMNTQLK
jgi:hypothetical protein